MATPRAARAHAWHEAYPQTARGSRLPPARPALSTCLRQDYVHEAALAGLVDVTCDQNTDAIVAVSVHGQRVAGVVKWIKDAYGFVQVRCPKP